MLKLRNALTLLGLIALICAVGCSYEDEADVGTTNSEPEAQVEAPPAEDGGPQVAEMMEGSGGPD